MNNVLPTTKGLDYLRLALAQRVDNETQQLRLRNSTSLRLVEVPLADHDISLLCDDSQSRLRPIIPQSLRFAVFQQFHSLSHPGIKTGVKLIGDRFVWTGMRKDIANFIKTCQQCAKSKVLRHNTTPLSPVLPPPTERFTHVYVNLTGPLNESSGYRNLMVIIDRFSRFFIHAIPLVGISSEECVSAFIHNFLVVQRKIFVTEELNSPPPYGMKCVGFWVAK